MSFRSILAAGFALLLAAMPATAQTPAFDEGQKAAIEDMIRDYLLKNPEIIEQAVEELQRRREEEATVARQKLVEDQSGILFNSTRQAVYGNPKGDVTVVEFFDYNCGFCKRALSDMQAILEADGNVRWVVKEFPVLSAGSVEAARVSIAVNLIAPEKHREFHHTLLGQRGAANKERAIGIATDMGLDVAAIEKRMEDPEVQAAIDEVYALATGLGINGTPTYVIGGDVIPGAVGRDELTGKIEGVRKCGPNSTSC